MFIQWHVGKFFPEYAEKRRKQEETLRNREVKALLFEDYLRTAERSRTGDQSIGGFFAALC